MGDFKVEARLEQLLPFLEELKNVELLEAHEVSQLAKQLRKYEYRLQKMTGKTAQDFRNYIVYLRDLLKLIRKRRAKTDYDKRRKQIERPLTTKIARTYIQMCNRSLGDLGAWREAISFMRLHKLNRFCSEMYTTALQFHSQNADLLTEAAEWELTGNFSVENARTQLQVALRRSPQEIKYWHSLFRVEIFFVKRMKERLEFLKKRQEGGVEEEDSHNEENESASKPENVPDAVMQLKLAEIVIMQAMKDVEKPERKAELLLLMWKSCRECGELADKLQKELLDRLNSMSEEGTSEYAQLALVQKRTEDGGENVFDCFKEALEAVPTKQMFTLFLEIADAQKDAEAYFAASQARRKMISLGFASIEDYKKVLGDFNIEDPKEAEEQRVMYKEAVKKFPDCIELWETVLSSELRLLEDSSNVSKEQIHTMAEMFNEAFTKTSLESHLPIWRLSIDFAIAYQPSTVEKLFARCFLCACPKVSSAIKVIRLDYLESSGDIEMVRKHARKLIDMKPNEIEVYAHVCALESGRDTPDHSLIKLAWECAVAEHSDLSSAWSGYAGYLMKHSPSTVSAVHQRATLCLLGDEAAKFSVDWIKLCQKSAAELVSDPKH